MSDSGEPDAQAWEEMYERGLFPERCPVCRRVNLRNGPDYCSHWWGTEYDGELIEGPYCEEFEELWSRLFNVYQFSDDIRSNGLIERLREAGLAEVARAVVDNDKFWWLASVEAKVFIEPEASMASGQGWSLYHKEAGWFESIMNQLRRAGEVSGSVTS